MCLCKHVFMAAAFKSQLLPLSLHHLFLVMKLFEDTAVLKL